MGGAVSAMTANGIATAVTGGQGVSDQMQLAAIVTATSLLGGAAAGLLDQNALAATNQLIKGGGWDLKFSPPRQPGQLPALIHALHTGK
ncbi:hypothetical protein QZM28_17945 [Burkholderia multivorans]|nr:hypothetical protein [Burkholderia multivorans]